MLKRTVQYLEIASLERDDELQARAALNDDVTREYAEDISGGAVFPPIVVFDDGAKHWLVDGYHRTAAREFLGHTTVLAEIRPGTREDAIWASVAANKTHGLRRSNADKQRAVERALLQPRAQKLSDRQIAAHCGVHHNTVGRVRKDLERSETISAAETRDVTRAGSTYSQRILGIRCSNRERRAVVADADRALRADAGTPASSAGCTSWAGAKRSPCAERVEDGAAASSPHLLGELPRERAGITRKHGAHGVAAVCQTLASELDHVLRLLSETRAWLETEGPKVSTHSGLPERLLRPLLAQVQELLRELSRVRDDLGQTVGIELLSDAADGESDSEASRSQHFS